MKQYVLNNGMRIIYYPIPPAQSVAIGLYVKAGSRYEHLNNNGISHMLEHIHFRHLGDMDQNELYNKMERNGGSLRASTKNDMIRFYMTIRPNRLAQSLEFFAGILTTYTWSEMELEQEKIVVLNELYEKSSYININTITNDVIWKKNPLRLPVIGREKCIKKFTVKDIIEYKKRAFSRNNLLLVFTGQIKEEDITMINEYFSEIELMPHCNVALDNAKQEQFNRKPDVCLDEQYWPVTDVDITFDVDLSLVSYEEYNMFSSMLGGGAGSILQKSIREKLGLSHNICTTHEKYEDAACLHIEYSVDNSLLYRSLAEILQLLQKLKTYIDPKNMDITLPFFTENLWLKLEDPPSFNEELGQEILIFNQPLYSIEEKAEQYKNITIPRLMAIAKIVFKPENASIKIQGSTNQLSKKKIVNAFREALI